MYSIRRRLTLYALLFIAALTIVGNLVVYFRVKTALKHQYDEGLLSRAGALSHLVAWDASGKMILEIPEEALDEFNRTAAPDYLEVWRPDGTVFLRSQGLGAFDLWRSPPGKSRPFGYLTLPDGRPGRATVLRFLPHLESDEPQAPVGERVIPPPPGETVLALASDTQRMERFLADLILAQIAGTVLLAALTALAVILAIGRVLKPLERLGREAAEFPAGALDRRFSVSQLPAELRPIAHRLNDLLSRIQEAFGRERRFTANVAHELRTPIAELRTLAEVALACPGTDAQPTAEFEETLAIARQMQTLVESLLALARAEASSAELRLREEDLESIVCGALRPYLDAARETGVRIDSRVESGRIVTDRALLESLLRNIFSNAVQYAPPKTTLTIDAQARDRRPQIAISNDAPDLEAEDLPRMAESFWRKDAARTQGAHSGLGFPLALAYARLLRLQIHPSLAGQRLTVRVSAEEAGAGGECDGQRVEKQAAAR